MNAGEWILRSRRVVTPSGTHAADVVIRRETIDEVVAYESPESEGVILDVGDLLVLPGLVALHMDGSGCLDSKGYDLASRDAASGGVTTLVALPDRDLESSPGIETRINDAEGNLRVDCALVAGLGHGRAHKVESWIETGAIAVEAFLDSREPDASNGLTEANLRMAMLSLAKLSRPLLVHAERVSRESRGGGTASRFRSTLPETEFEALRLLIRICRETRCRVHLIHPTAAEALPMIAEARAEGLPLTVETCPHHMSFATEEIADGVPTFALKPRNPEPNVRDRLWEGLRQGLIDSVGADHPQAFPIPHHAGPGEIRLARREYTSLRFALPAVWTEARRRGFAPDAVARWMSSNTARAFGLARRKGAISPGLDADFVVLDTDATSIADPDPLHRRHPFPPLDGRMLDGAVEATILRGSLIYEAGRFLDPARGTIIVRLEDTLPMHQTMA